MSKSSSIVAYMCVCTSTLSVLCQFNKCGASFAYCWELIWRIFLASNVCIAWQPQLLLKHLSASSHCDPHSPIALFLILSMSGTFGPKLSSSLSRDALEIIYALMYTTRPHLTSQSKEEALYFFFPDLAWVVSCRPVDGMHSL